MDNGAQPALWKHPGVLRAVIGVAVVIIIALAAALGGRLDHWIGLRKDAGGVWRWVNGTEFDHRFEIQGGADCAYLDDDLNVSSSSCSTPRKWLCSKPDAPTQGGERVVGGRS
ncbi:C-type lectin domain family 2 member D-like isoform X3 [Pelodiscus sinensis]|uniref:C-type lectin domain family 2 member D-like isoform X3 n=1 Tax=Pelodiscus sinensis TaxID=13735 RepID=UPI003F6BDB38